MENVIVVGDLHGNWAALNTLINKKRPDVILQVGDFGWWPHYHKSTKLDGSGKPWNQYGVKAKDTKIYWCPGNHENWDDLDIISEENDGNIHEVMDNVFYCEFGSTIKLADGRVVLFVGGAESIDKDHRIMGNTWWSQETISYNDIDKLPDIDVDIVISHTIPNSFIMAFPNVFDLSLDRDRIRDSSRYALDLILVKYNPSLWFSGHFHRWEKRTFKDCVWESLDYAGSQGKWWTKL